MRRADSLEKTDAGKDWGQEEKGTTEDEMAGWHHRLNGCEFGWTLGVGDGQGSLVCCNSWDHKESDMTERLNWTELMQGWLNIKKIIHWNNSFNPPHQLLKKNLCSSINGYRKDLTKLNIHLFVIKTHSKQEIDRNFLLGAYCVSLPTLKIVMLKS